MIPPHLFYQIYLSFLEQNDCTPPKCGELSEYTDSAHTEVEDLSSRYQHILFTVIWRMVYAKGPFRLRERKSAVATRGTSLFDEQQGFFYMHRLSRQDNTYHGLC